MSFDDSFASEIVALAKRLSSPESFNPKSRQAILTDFLKAAGFRNIFAEAKGEKGNAEIVTVAMETGAGDGPYAAIFAPSLSCIAEDDSWNLAAFAALAVVFSKGEGGRKVAFVTAEEDDQRTQTNWRYLAETLPTLKSSKLLLVPSPVRPFYLNDLMVFPLVFAFKGSARLQLKSSVSKVCIDCPDASDAIGRLNRALIRIANQKLPNQVTQAAKIMFCGLRRAGGPWLSLKMAGASPTLAGMALEGGLDGSPLNLPVAAATRNTVCPVAVGADASTLTSPVPLNAWAMLEVSLLPETDVRNVMFQLREMLNDEALTLLPEGQIPPAVSPWDSPRFLSLMKSIADQGLSARPVPWLSPRRPDSLVLASVGTHVYGLPTVGNPMGDELAVTAWIKSVASLATGLEESAG